jgi:quinol monooxygenase YgiN
MITLDWLEFAEDIKYNNRFFPRDNGVKHLIDELLKNHTKRIKKGTKFYRARIISLNEMTLKNDDMLQGFPEIGSMSPDPEIATAQRASPQKISYLYVAEDEYTALSETRPGLLSFVSLAEIEACDDLVVFDMWFDIENYDSMREEEQLAASFSAVISEKEKEIDYLPMQYVAEYIKSKGADGIRYVSLQSSGGKNLVIFNEKNKVSFIQSKILYTKNVTYSFLNLTNPVSQPLIGDIDRNILPIDFAEQIRSSVLQTQNKNTNLVLSPYSHHPIKFHRAT